MKNKFICCKGLSFSGKSQWAAEKAKELGNCVVITKDDIRKEMGANYLKNIRVKESKVIAKRNELILDALRKGKNIISADTNFSVQVNHIENMKSLVYPKYRDTYDFEIKDFTDVPLDVLLYRANKTNRPEGKEFWKRVILEQKKNWLRPIQIYEDPNYYNSDLPLAIIVDLDNTFKGGRSAYADDCSGDTPNIPVVEIVKMYCDRPDITIICLSGRKESARQSTENWLAAHNIKYNHLYMRGQDDNRRDSIMKREVYEKEIKGKFLIHLVLDDREMVCEMWQEYGLPLLKFGNSNF